MPFNGSGTYSLPAGNPVVANTTASSTVRNNSLNDIATALSNCVTKDGQSTPTANIPMGGYEVTNVGDGTALTSAATVKQLQNNGAITLSSVSGTDTITATCTPVPSAYASGQIFVFEPAANNTGAATINISSLGAKDIYINNAALGADVLVSGQPVVIRYNGTQFEIIGKADFASLGAANNFGANQGIGVSPITSDTTDLELGTQTTRLSNFGNNSYLLNNAYQSSGYKYTTNGVAQAYIQTSAGAHQFRIAASGTAGNAITWTDVFTILSTTSCEFKTNTSGFGVLIDNDDTTSGASSLRLDLSSGAAGKLLRGFTGGGEKVYIEADGDLFNTNGTYGTISDRRLKKNIVKNTTPRFPDIDKLEVVNYELIDSPESGKLLGFIAQDFEEVFPGLVKTNAEGFKSIKTSALIPMFVQVIQEAKKEIENLSARIEKLENNSKG